MSKAPMKETEVRPMYLSFLYALLTGLQILGIAVAAVAAVAEIETIVFSGPVLSLNGLLLLAASISFHRKAGYWFALSVPTMSVLTFSLILGFELAPHEAQAPIGTLITIFAIAAVPLGIYSLVEHSHQAKASKQLVQLRFTMMTLLGLTTLVAIPLGLAATFEEVGLAVGLLLSYVLLVTAMTRWLRTRDVAIWPSRRAAPWKELPPLKQPLSQ